MSKLKHFVSVFIAVFVVWTPVTTSFPASARSNETARNPYVETLAWSPVGNILAVGYSDGTLEVFDTDTGHRYINDKKFLVGISDLAWSPTGDKVAACSGPEIRVYDIYSGVETLAIFDLDEMTSISWSPNGQMIAASHRRGSGYTIAQNMTKIWDAYTGELLFSLRGHHLDVLTSVDWSPDGTQIATASADHTAILWDVQTKTPLHILEGHQYLIQEITWSHDGTRIATVSYLLDNSVRVWSSTSGEILLTIPGTWTEDISWSPSDDQLAIADDTQVVIIDSSTGALLDTLSASDRVYAVDWSPDGTQLAYGGADGILEIVAVAPSD